MIAHSALYLEPAACAALGGVDRRWLRRHIPHRRIGRKRWYLGIDLLHALAGERGDRLAQLPDVPLRDGAVVYFIQHAPTGAIKIGSTRHLAARLKDHQTSNPDELRLVGVLAGTAADERALHRRFAADRKHGEWFRLSRELIALLEEMHG